MTRIILSKILSSPLWDTKSNANPLLIRKQQQNMPFLPQAIASLHCSHHLKRLQKGSLCSLNMASKIRTYSAHLSFWLRLQASMEYSVFWFIWLVKADLIKVSFLAFLTWSSCGGKATLEHVLHLCPSLNKLQMVSGWAARTWDRSYGKPAKS